MVRKIDTGECDFTHSVLKRRRRPASALGARGSERAQRRVKALGSNSLKCPVARKKPLRLKNTPGSCVHARRCVHVCVRRHPPLSLLRFAFSFSPRDYISVYGADKSAPSTSLISSFLRFAPRFPSSSCIVTPGFDARHPRPLPDSLTPPLFDIFLWLFNSRLDMSEGTDKIQQKWIK